MYVKDIMKKDVAVCTPDKSVQECASLMVENDCGEIPVVQSKEDYTLVGVITDRDIACRVVAKGVEPAKAKVRDYMTKDVYTVSEQDDLNHCNELMSTHQVRRLPVVDDDRTCVGIISQAHAARHLSEEEAGGLAKDLSRSRNSAEAPTQNTAKM